MEIETHDIVEECLKLLRHGSSLEECLELYPKEAAELEPVLRSAISVRSGLETDLPATARARIRGQVLTEWDRQHHLQPKRWDWRISSIFPKLALTVIRWSMKGIWISSSPDAPSDVKIPPTSLLNCRQFCWRFRSGWKVFSKNPMVCPPNSGSYPSVIAIPALDSV
jgi:hypothetical protein